MKTAILLPLCLLFTIASATHNRAGEILYQRIQPTTTVVNNVTVDVFRYRISVIRYFDYGPPSIADRCADTVYFGDGTKGVAFRTNGSVNACLAQCHASVACGSVIINQPGYVVTENIYEIEHTYPGPGTYIITSSDPNRNPGIVNLPNSSNQPMVLETTLIVNSLSGMNSSPRSANPPLGQATNVNCFYYNSLATDVDGDSLKYELNPSVGTGFSFPTSGVNGYFFITSAGQLQWCQPQSAGEYIFRITVKEYRKNSNNVYQLIGTVNRDMQVIVRTGVLHVGQNDSEQFFKLSPNPFSDEVKLDVKNTTAGNAQISFYSVDGKNVLTTNVSGDAANVNTQTLAPGVYLVKISNGQKTAYAKLIKD